MLESPSDYVESALEAHSFLYHRKPLRGYSPL